MAEKPDFRSISKGDAKEAKFPAQIAGDYRVYFAEDAYEKMKKHTTTTNEVELCGVLIGDVFRDNQGFFLKIDAVIEGQNANNYGAQVTFTHQTWEHINSIKDKQYPSQRIVGWYHTHPGFGVFLSGMDVFIQENTFNHPYQVAIVVETKQNVEGCFVWIDGKSVPIGRYWVGDREIKLATGTAEKFEIDNPSGPLAAAAMPRVERAAQAPPQESGAGVLMGLLTSVAFFFCGLLLGQYLELNKLRQTALNELQSELYSMVQFAALNTAASQDLATVNEKLAAIDQKVKQNDASGAGQGLKELSEQVKGLAANYAKKPVALRAELEELQYKKQHLGEQVDTVARQQNVLDKALADLYYLRIADLATKNGTPVDPGTLSTAERDELKARIEKTVRLAPGLKQVIKNDFSKLYDVLYPEGKAAEGTTPTGTGK